MSELEARNKRHTFHTDIAHPEHMSGSSPDNVCDVCVVWNPGTRRTRHASSSRIEPKVDLVLMCDVFTWVPGCPRSSCRTCGSGYSPTTCSRPDRPRTRGYALGGYVPNFRLIDYRLSVYSDMSRALSTRDNRHTDVPAHYVVRSGDSHHICLGYSCS